MRQKENQSDDTQSLLTERQLRVLELRSKGYSQQEVAEMIGTTRSNISILEKRAHQNIARARRTLQQWSMIQSPISLRIRAGTDVFDLPAMIFKAADEKAIQLPMTSLDLITQLRIRSPQIFRKRAVSKDVDICITEKGEVLVQEPSETIRNAQR